MDDFDVVGGLYWTKGEGGQPMLYGDPKVEPINFIPQIPISEGIQPANGLGMGFNLFKMEIFKDERFSKSWFKTLQEFNAVEGVRAATQDLFFVIRTQGNLDINLPVTRALSRPLRYQHRRRVVNGKKAHQTEYRVRVEALRFRGSSTSTRCTRTMISLPEGDSMRPPP